MGKSGAECLRAEILGVNIHQDRHSPAVHSGLVLLQVVFGDLQDGDNIDHVQCMKLWGDLEPLHQGEEVALQGGAVNLTLFTETQEKRTLST